LEDLCSKCGSVAIQASPIKWSPEDKHAHLRRRLSGVELEGWASTLPTLSDVEEA
jgi:rRNA maturation protein Nop10